MKELTFEKVYENLQKKFEFSTNEELLRENQVVDKILELDSEYREFRKNIKYDTDIDKQKKSKKCGKLVFNIYMRKTCYNDFEVDGNYKVVDTPEKVYYETSMSISNTTHEGIFTIDNILSLKDSNIDKVQTRYDYLSYILDNYTEQELLHFINNQILV